ncbi:FadR family transcriptional regulator [Brachybacterium muris]|nr:FadR/GntR family transcriptional regulator [Brachybacterium muris]MCT2176277.1 FadR family transcriptional regulator [Brachybacterium muris]
MTQMAVTDKAISAIKNMIIDGELKPGDRLPPEKQLSERIGVSRNSLREAVKALSVIQVLSVRQGDGTYVTSLEPELLIEALGFVLDLHQDAEVLHIMEVRRLLEPTAVEKAGDHLEEADYQYLEGLMAPLGPDSPVGELVEADIAFHHHINAHCGNAYLSSLLDGFASATARARLWRGLTEGASVGRTLEEHYRIINAMRAGRADLAKVYAAAHVAGVEAWVIQGAHTGTKSQPDFPAAEG